MSLEYQCICGACPSCLDAIRRHEESVIRAPMTASEPRPEIRCDCVERGLTAHDPNCVIFTLPRPERLPLLMRQSGIKTDPRDYTKPAPLPEETPAPSIPPTTFWLLERSQPEGVDPPQWWVKWHNWTKDATKAHRFPSREAAEARVPNYLWAHVVEHAFVDPSPPPSPPSPDTRAELKEALDEFQVALEERLCAGPERSVKRTRAARAALVALFERQREELRDIKIQAAEVDRLVASLSSSLERLKAEQKRDGVHIGILEEELNDALSIEEQREMHKRISRRLSISREENKDQEQLG